MDVEQQWLMLGAYRGFEGDDEAQQARHCKRQAACPCGIASKRGSALQLEDHRGNVVKLLILQAERWPSG